ncbi:MAG: ImmA/IrrE family metallo-endopeptidase, partial [Blastocatellia bacterium]
RQPAGWAPIQPLAGARGAVHRLRQLHGDVSAQELARIYGVEILRDRWRVADGRLIYFAECSFDPPKITLNAEAIELAARSGSDCSAEDERRWFTQSQIAEVVIAHELYHILARQSSSPEVESAANEFARSFTGAPFSPSRYEMVLRRAGRINSSLITPPLGPF